MAASKQVLLFIADISGYTSYMLTNNRASEHAKRSISLLISCLVKQIELPLKISKLEGDAIFLYLLSPSLQGDEDRLWLTKKIFTFFDLFEKKVHELKLAGICKCGACQNIESLKLKVIAHYGEASVHKIGPFTELVGVDVIILHRLLKNHVPSHRYFLLTEAAYRQMLIPDTLKVSKFEESYKDVGTIPIYVCDPPPVPEGDFPQKAPFSFKIHHWLTLHFGHPGSAFHNLPKKPGQKA
jgi:hypothetical protein